jgi:hypothetical protein
MPQADEARKAIVELPARMPKRLRGHLALLAYGERKKKQHTTMWLHAVHGDPITGKEKRLARRELGFGRGEVGGEVEADPEEMGGADPKDVDVSEFNIDLKIENPTQHTMPRTFLDGLSEVEFTATSQAVRDDFVVTRWEVIGTHSNELLGVPATGASITIAGITMLKFAEQRRPEGGRDVWATDEWTYWDLESLIGQLKVGQ